MSTIIKNIYITALISIYTINLSCYAEASMPVTVNKSSFIVPSNIVQQQNFTKLSKNNISKKSEDISGKCGTNLIWTLNITTGILSITGTGKMDNYNYKNTPPWSSVAQQIKSVNIEEGVTSIGDNAFSNCMALNSITDLQCMCMHDKKEIIPIVHFYRYVGCKNLTSINIPESVTSIGKRAFSNCVNLASVVIPDTVDFIGDFAFYGCKNLISFSYFGTNDSNFSSNEILYGCDKLTSVFVTSSYKSNKFCNIPVSLIDDLSCVIMIKNEAPYIKEWIEYHKLVGVTKFYIYDNESTDNLKEILKDYIESGEVIYKYFPGTYVLTRAYQDAVDNYKYNTKYLGIIDVDEFIVPVEKENIVDAVEDIIKKDKNIAGIGINWLNYGSSGLIDKPKGLVIENFKYRSLLDHVYNKQTKSIINPRKVGKVEVHTHHYKTGYYSVNEVGEVLLKPKNNQNRSYKKLRINHYFTKSKSEYINNKKNKGRAERPEPRTMEEFYKRDKNDVYDYIMEKYVDKLKSKLKT